MTTLDDLFSVAGHVVAITGAASGIGRAIAVYLANLGATVYALDLDEPELPEPIVPVAADVADEQAGCATFRSPRTPHRRARS